MQPGEPHQRRASFEIRRRHRSNFRAIFSVDNRIFLCFCCRLWCMCSSHSGRWPTSLYFCMLDSGSSEAAASGYQASEREGRACLTCKQSTHIAPPHSTMSASPSRRRRDGAVGSKIPSKTVSPGVQGDAKSKGKAKGKRKRRDEVKGEGGSKTVGELLAEYARKTRTTSARVRALPEDAPLPERTVQVSTRPRGAI